MLLLSESMLLSELEEATREKQVSEEQCKKNRYEWSTGVNGQQV